MAQAQEFDDFGLPIRRFPTPPPIETSTPTEATPNKEETSKEPAKDFDIPSKPENSERALASETLEALAGQHGNDDEEDETFEDAQSEQKHKTKVDSTPGVKSPPSEAADAALSTSPGNKSDGNIGHSESDANNADSTVADTKPDKQPTDTAEKAKSIETTIDAQQVDYIAAVPAARRSTEPRRTSGHSREESIPGVLPGERASEFSHQIVPARAEDAKDKSKGEDKDEEGWQEMPSYARYDMYDDDNRLIAREHNDEEIEKYGYGDLGGAGKGYTRVLLDDDADSVTSLDENTQYLFKTGAGTSALDNEDTRDAMSQMQATKDLLTEGQRIAYVGVVRLEIANMVKETESLDATNKTKKDIGMASEAMRMWGQKMMIRLYAHMDISEAEQVMIEQLAEHGVMPGDLTPALHANSRVSNPMAESKNGSARQSMSSNPKSPVEDAPPPYESLDAEGLSDVKMPSQLPSTDKIDIDLRWTVLCDLFLILIADSIYDARSRELLEKVGKSIEIMPIDICRFEKKVTEALEMQQAAEKENWNEEEHMENRRKQALKKRYMMMGLATVGGGLVIGLSAGLMAPLIGAGLAAGFGTIGVTGTTTFLSGVGGAAVITSSAAASGSLIGGRAANRRTGAVSTFEYRPLHNNKRVNLIVTVSGWLTGKVDDVRLPFSTVDPVMGDLYSVLWEPDLLRSMGDTINILATEALTQGLQQVLGSTILVALMSALQLPVVLTKLSYLIDNPWAVSLDRATAAGKILADSLVERNLGTRPITLVGYSLGARVIFSCLQELAKKGAYGIVQNVYMFGSPIVIKKEEYQRTRTVVSGRFVNAYNRNDWILGYLFRLTNGGIRRVAGLVPIEECSWLENMDVTDMVGGHMEYRKHMPALLKRCGWSVESEEFTEIEDPDPENHEGRQRQLINDIEEACKELEREGKAGNKNRFSLFGRKKRAEKQEWEIYDDKGTKGGPSSPTVKSSNEGVLFDVDAIRAELAKESRYGDEELQVKEIKSTLPPMRLDLPPATPPPSTPGQNLRDYSRGTKSAEALPRPPSSATQSPSWGRQNQAPLYPPDAYEDDGGIQMTFDTGFDNMKPSTPVKDDTTRPELKSTSTLPNMTLKDPWADMDDDDFGKEKEIQMTFA